MRKIFLCLMIIISTATCKGFAQDAKPDYLNYTSEQVTKILDLMDVLMVGKSQEGKVRMNVYTPKWQREYEMDIWVNGLDYTKARLTKPAKSQGQTFLRIKSKLWNYMPSAERTILIPISMMLDHFMGSDFTNDDFMKLTYVSRDYFGKIIKEDVTDQMPTLHIELTPKPEAPVKYGKIDLWVRQDTYAPVHMLFYDEAMVHIRTLHYSDYKMFGTHDLPTTWKMDNIKEEGKYTVIKMLDVKFDHEIPMNVFSKENLEKGE